MPELCKTRLAPPHGAAAAPPMLAATLPPTTGTTATGGGTDTRAGLGGVTCRAATRGDSCDCWPAIDTGQGQAGPVVTVGTLAEDPWLSLSLVVLAGSCEALADGSDCRPNPEAAATAAREGTTRDPCWAPACDEAKAWPQGDGGRGDVERQATPASEMGNAGIITDRVADGNTYVGWLRGEAGDFTITEGDGLRTRSRALPFGAGLAARNDAPGEPSIMVTAGAPHRSLLLSASRTPPPSRG